MSYEDDFDEAGYAEDMQAQNAVDDAKYDAMFPEQDEPPEGYYDVVRPQDDDEEDYGAGHTGSAEPPAYAVWALAYSNEPPF